MSWDGGPHFLSQYSTYMLYSMTRRADGAGQTGFAAEAEPSSPPPHPVGGSRVEPVTIMRSLPPNRVSSLLDELLEASARMWAATGRKLGIYSGVDDVFSEFPQAEISYCGNGSTQTRSHHYTFERKL